MFGRVKGIKFDKKGLIPAIVQDAATQEVLMMVRMDKKALKKTMDTGELWLYNRSLKKVWKKGQHSGNTMTVRSMHLHHNKSVLLVLATPHGPACHTGNSTCFYETYWQSDKSANGGMNQEISELEEMGSDLRGKADAEEQSTVSGNEVEVESEVEKKTSLEQENVLNRIYNLIQKRRVNSGPGSYTSQLLRLGKEEIAKKLGAEATALALNLAQDQPQRIVRKSADLLYHWLLLLVDQGISLTEVFQELQRRHQDEGATQVDLS